MSSIQHKLIAEAELHESKGVSTATSDKVYVTNGLGSGSWSNRVTYGELFITSGVTAQAITTTTARLDPGTAWTAGNSLNTTLTAVDGTFTAVTTGTYSLNYGVSFTTDAVAAGTLYTCQFALDGVVFSRSISVQKVTAAAERLNINGTGFSTITAGQVVSIYIKSSIASTITPVEANFSIRAL